MAFYSKKSDADYLSMLYRRFFKGKKKLNLDTSQTLTEKIQWLKLYDHRSFYPNMVDKYEVKKLVAERVGEEYVLPTLGIYDKFDDINFDALPDKFVLKCTHDSGGNYFCRDKEKFDKEEARAFLKKDCQRILFCKAGNGFIKILNQELSQNH